MNMNLGPSQSVAVTVATSPFTPNLPADSQPSGGLTGRHDGQFGGAAEGPARRLAGRCAAVRVLRAPSRWYKLRIMHIIGYVRACI
jgi:hypothetical protein